VFIKKCFFGLREMEYMGYTLYAGKFSVSTKKVDAVADSAMPTMRKEVRSFVQFCNFYARFIHLFISDLTALYATNGLYAEGLATEGYANARVFGSL
jgi:hypothetical protein